MKEHLVMLRQSPVNTLKTSMKPFQSKVLPLYERVLKSGTLEKTYLVDNLLQLAKLCDFLSSQLSSLEGEVTRRMLSMTRRLDSIMLLARARATRMAVGRADEADKLMRTNRSINAELDQVMRENDRLRKEVDHLEQQLQQHLGKLEDTSSSANFGPTIVVTDEENDVGVLLQKPSTVHSSSSNSSNNSDVEAARLNVLKNRALVRELRKDLLSSRKKQRLLATALVQKDCDVVAAQCHISELQQEIDNQRRECYGHLKAMQQLRGTTSSPPPRPASPSSKEDEWSLKLELSKVRRELAKARTEIELITKS